MYDSIEWGTLILGYLGMLSLKVDWFLLGMYVRTLKYIIVRTVRKKKMNFVVKEIKFLLKTKSKVYLD